MEEKSHDKHKKSDQDDLQDSRDTRKREWFQIMGNRLDWKLFFFSASKYIYAYKKCVCLSARANIVQQ